MHQTKAGQTCFWPQHGFPKLQHGVASLQMFLAHINGDGIEIELFLWAYNCVVFQIYFDVAKVCTHIHGSHMCSFTYLWIWNASFPDGHYCCVLISHPVPVGVFFFNLLEQKTGLVGNYSAIGGSAVNSMQCRLLFKQVTSRKTRTAKTKVLRGFVSAD